MLMALQSCDNEPRNPLRCPPCPQFLPTSPAELERVDVAAWCQIFQSALYLEAKEGRHYAGFLPRHVLPLAQAAWERRSSHTSFFQAEVGVSRRLAARSSSVLLASAPAPASAPAGCFYSL